MKDCFVMNPLPHAHPNASRFGLDFIGDIHGQCDKLERLLSALGYAQNAGTFRHPEGRRAVFLGDYIDRGPRIRDTLKTVRSMTEAGAAFAVMGNHEFNAIAYATERSVGGYLREHSEKNRHQHEATLAQFQHFDDERQDWLTWFRELPMWLDFGGARAIHACWDAKSIEVLAAGELSDPCFLEVCATEGTPEFEALEVVLKGPELALPPGIAYWDKQGVERHRIRSRWWGIDEGVEALTYADLAMPPGQIACDAEVPSDQLAGLPNDPATSPVFVGHYWLPPTTPRTPMAPSVACLDYSAGLDGPLVAYRWDGESTLLPEKFIASSTPETAII